MTPKEKAKELVDKMWVYALPNSDGSWANAKTCALIAVEEILKLKPDSDYYVINATTYINGSFWEAVKTEIEKL